MLNTILRFFGTKGANVILNFDEYGFIRAAREKQREFFKSYLAYDFEPGKTQFDILSFLADKTIFSNEEADDLLVHSNYFRMMPDVLIYPLLMKLEDGHYPYPEFSKYLIKRLNNPLELALLSSKYESSQLAKQLVQSCDIDNLINVYVSLNDSFRNAYLNREIANYYSLKDIQRYCLETKIGVLEILNIFSYLLKREEKVQVIDTMVEVVLKKNHILGRVKGQERTPFEIFYGYVNTYFLEDIDTVALSVLKSDNTVLMYQWVLNTKSKHNTDIVDRLIMMKDYLFIGYLTGEYLEYAIKKMIADNKLLEFVDRICMMATVYEVNQLDLVIDSIYRLNPGFELSRKQALEVIKAGSKYALKMLEKYDFEQEERDEIYRFYKRIGSELGNLFGAYLISGEKNKLLSEEQMKKVREKNVKLK